MWKRVLRVGLHKIYVEISRLDLLFVLHFLRIVTTLTVLTALSAPCRTTTLVGLKPFNITTLHLGSKVHTVVTASDKPNRSRAAFIMIDKCPQSGANFKSIVETFWLKKKKLKNIRKPAKLNS